MECLKAITKVTGSPFCGRTVINSRGCRQKTGVALTTELNSAGQGKRVLVVDDGPTLTHGGRPFGAGYVQESRAPRLPTHVRSLPRDR
jgi:hypothetical protein